MLSIAQDIRNEIAPYQAALNTALRAATCLPLVGHPFDGLQALNPLLQNSLQSIEAKTQNIASGHVQLAIPPRSEASATLQLQNTAEEQKQEVLT